MQLSKRKINSETMKLINLFPLKSFFMFDHILFFPYNIHLRSYFISPFFLSVSFFFFYISKNENKTKLTNNKNNTRQNEAQTKQKTKFSQTAKQNMGQFCVGQLLGLGLALDWLVCSLTLHWRKLISSFASRLHL